MINDETIEFIGVAKSHWISVICAEQNREYNINNIEIHVNINGINSIHLLEPMHIVLLACLRQNLKDKGYDRCYLSTNNIELQKFLFDDVNLGKYWRGEKPINHIDSTKETVFNLWHVTETELEFYSRDVMNFLKKRFFKSKDLSSVQESLIECFRNVFDHADAQGNSFSYIRFDKSTSKLQVAICDFGKGIAKSIRDYFPNIVSDSSALLKAIEYKVTTRSKAHNSGFGLGNVISHQIQ